MRLGWGLPPGNPAWVHAHGPLMVSGFLGTVISLERAIGLGRRPGYLVPALIGAGTAATLVAPAALPGPVTITAGSVGLVILLGAACRRRPDLAGALLVGAGATWLVGNLLWITGQAIPRLLPWWIGFPVLTIAAERLELSRFAAVPPGARRLFAGLAILCLLATTASLLRPGPSFRVLGLVWLGLALWLLRWDLARASLFAAGIPRFAAAGLLPGYVWLAAAGAGAAVRGNPLSGPPYDALVHAIFVGFVFSMIFGHAPIIFPAILRRSIRLRPGAYVLLALLHSSLVARIGGDLTGATALRQWGALVNAVVIVGYLALTAASLERRPGSADPPP